MSLSNQTSLHLVCVTKANYNMLMLNPNQPEHRVGFGHRRTCVLDQRVQRLTTADIVLWLVPHSIKLTHVVVSYHILPGYHTRYY